MLSCTQLFATPWTVACQTPLSMGFSRQETEGSCHALLQGVFPTQGSNAGLLCLLHWQVGSLPLSHLGSPNLIIVDYNDEYFCSDNYVQKF